MPQRDDLEPVARLGITVADGGRSKVGAGVKSASALTGLGQISYASRYTEVGICFFFPGRYAIKEPSERIKMAFYRHRRRGRLRSSEAVILAEAGIHGSWIPVFTRMTGKVEDDGCPSFPAATGKPGAMDPRVHEDDGEGRG